MCPEYIRVFMLLFCLWVSVYVMKKKLYNQTQASTTKTLRQTNP